ncbi:PQQ-binding-like beta-propeller repeat protein [Zavarzinella formosa]|uniref:PQQ-binding-like beta-propeller repeat protein n=1 Tax=Zavarzinella formosa TaxID=360055 RepID=UPI0002FDCC60|nr:PQQ-binding-like beta-propeller repeat protein [Zavarzinella formosa]
MKPLLVLLLGASVAVAGDWPQWLGPNRDGVSTESVTPWKEPLKPLWKVKVGEGNSSPVVVGNLVFLHTKVAGKDMEKIQAFDVKTGDMKWAQVYEKFPFAPKFGEGPRATPVVADGKVYTFGNTGTLACWEAADGKPVWKIETLKDAKKDNLFFGLSASPLVTDKLVIVQGGGKTSKGVKAYDRLTGKEAWTAGEDAASYAAPVFIDGEIVALTGANLVGISLDGKVKWKVPFMDALNESSTTPIKSGDLYVAGSVTAGSIGIKVEKGSAESKVEQAWKNPKLTCYFSTPVPVSKEHLYVVTGSIANPSVTLRCVETATGKEVWNKTKVGKYHAALLKMADGNLLMHADNGQLTLLKPNAKEYEEVCTSPVCGPTWAHPALANGVLFVRDDKELIAISLPGK